MSVLSNRGEAARLAAAKHAAGLVRSGMQVGLGTGSTSALLVREIGSRTKEEGLRLTVVPTSRRTEELARIEGLTIADPENPGSIDIAIDGADECDPQLNLIKGGGGALFREKLVAASAGRFVVIADIAKRVDALGRFPLPVEVTRFAWNSTNDRILRCLESSGFGQLEGSLRQGDAGPFVTDEGNLIIDYALGRIEDPPALHAELVSIVGVVETGIFAGLCEQAVFGQPDGTVVVDTPVATAEEGS